MTLFWSSLALTLAILAITMPLGGTLLFVQATLVLLLPHLLIGDLFHWSHFPRLGPWEKAAWLLLAAGGVVVFFVIRGAGESQLPLFFVYFLGHFWKDLDLGFHQARAETSRPEAQRAKRWCGLLLLVAYTVTSSGLIRDPQVIQIAKRIDWAAAGVLIGRALVGYVRLRRDAAAVEALWARYAGFAGCFLVLCTWLNAQHPARTVLPYLLVIWHFMLWYVFYWSAVRHTAPARVQRPRHGLDWLKQSAIGFTTFVVVANLLAAGGALLYATTPHFVWLKYLYNFDYLAGCWTVMHVTWDWVPKDVKGIRLSVV
jgi:hypothetical protein